jgi:hypothetical protein
MFPCLPNAAQVPGSRTWLNQLGPCPAFLTVFFGSHVTTISKHKVTVLLTMFMSVGAGDIRPDFRWLIIGAVGESSLHFCF